MKNVSLFKLIREIIHLTGLRWMWLIAAILVIDRISKFLVCFHFYLGEIKSLFPLVNIYYTINYGAAFSFLASSSGWQRWFFSGVSIAICIVLLLLMYRSRDLKKLSNVAYAMIVGGALGNLYDRLWYGFVVDMIDFYVGDWHFATFNFSDSAIFIGAVLIIIEIFFKKVKKI